MKIIPFLVAGFFIASSSAHACGLFEDCEKERSSIAHSHNRPQAQAIHKPSPGGDAEMKAHIDNIEARLRGLAKATSTAHARIDDLSMETNAKLDGLHSRIDSLSKKEAQEPPRALAGKPTS